MELIVGYSWVRSLLLLSLPSSFSGLSTVALKVILLQPTKRAEDVTFSYLLHHPAVVNGGQVQFSRGTVGTCGKVTRPQASVHGVEKVIVIGAECRRLEWQHGPWPAWWSLLPSSLEPRRTG